MAGASCGRSLLNSFDEAVETDLPLQHVHLGRARGFFLECQMHAFVPAVLLRVARPDPFDGNSEPQPLGRELWQVVESVRTGEGAPLSLRIAFGKQPEEGRRRRWLPSSIRKPRRLKGGGTRSSHRHANGERTRMRTIMSDELGNTGNDTGKASPRSLH
jgi:hypothetical protein